MEQEEGGGVEQGAVESKMAKPSLSAVTVKTQHVSRNVTQLALIKLY